MRGTAQRTRGESGRGDATRRFVSLRSGRRRPRPRNGEWAERSRRRWAGRGRPAVRPMASGALSSVTGGRRRGSGGLFYFECGAKANIVAAIRSPARRSDWRNEKAQSADDRRPAKAQANTTRTYAVQFVVEAAGVADRLSVVVAPPQRRRRRTAVGARDAASAISILLPSRRASY